MLPSSAKQFKHKFSPKTMFRCRFLAIVDVRTIYRDHAKHATQVVFE